jgi:hypothetical protein
MGQSYYAVHKFPNFLLSCTYFQKPIKCILINFTNNYQDIIYDQEYLCLDKKSPSSEVKSPL